MICAQERGRQRILLEPSPRVLEPLITAFLSVLSKSNFFFLISNNNTSLFLTQLCWVHCGSVLHSRI